MCDFSTKEVSPEFRRKTSREKEARQFIARATQQVFPLCQPAIQWWQLELPLQRRLVSVAAGAVVGAGVVAGVTVSVFCSQAARKRGSGQNADVFLHSWKRILL